MAPLYTLALHYVAALDAVFAGVYRVLVDGGRFVFSVEHPIITSCARGWQSGRRQDWIVDDYFVVGPRQTAWLGGEVIRQHRTVEGYVAAISDSPPAAARHASGDRSPPASRRRGN